MNKDGNGTMKMKDIVELGTLLQPNLTNDAYLFLWVTTPTMDKVIEHRLFEAWGFRYVGVAFVWVKTYRSLEEFAEEQEWNQFPVWNLDVDEDNLVYGLGHYIPTNIELCMFGVRLKGKPWHPHEGARPKQVWCGPRPVYPKGTPPAWDPFEEDWGKREGKMIHSRKPEIFHQRIERWLQPSLGGHDMLEMFATQRRPGWLTMGHELTGTDIREDLRQMTDNPHAAMIRRSISPPGWTNKTPGGIITR